MIEHLQLTRANLEAFARLREDRLVARLSARWLAGASLRSVDPSTLPGLLRSWVRRGLQEWNILLEEHFLSLLLALDSVGLLDAKDLPEPVIETLEHPVLPPAQKVTATIEILEIPPPSIPDVLPEPPPEDVLLAQEPYLSPTASPMPRSSVLEDELPMYLASSRVFLLLDGARHPEIARLAESMGEEHAAPVLAGTSLKTGLAGPYLFLFRDEPWQLVRDRLWHLPWGLVITTGSGSPPHITDVAGRFRRLLVARLPTGKAYLLRLHDPAVLQIFLASSPPGVLRPFLGPHARLATCWEATGERVLSWTVGP